MITITSLVVIMRGHIYNPYHYNTLRFHTEKKQYSDQMTYKINIYRFPYNLQQQAKSYIEERIGNNKCPSKDKCKTIQTITVMV